MKLANFRGRLLISFFLLTAIPTLLVFSLYLRSYLLEMEEAIAESVLQTLKQASLNISNEVQNVYRISEVLFVNEDIRLAMRTSPKNQPMDDQILEISRMEDAITAVKQGSEIKAIRLYVNDDKIYANEGVSFSSLTSFFETMPAWVSAKGDLIATHEELYKTMEPAYVISLARLIKDVREVGLIIGAMVIDVEESQFSSILDQMDFPEDSLIYLADETGMVLSHPQNTLYGQSRTLFIEDMNLYGESIQRVDETLYVTKKVERTPWYLVAELPRDGIQKTYLSTRATLLLYIIISAILIGITLVVMMLITDGVARRVQRLVSILRDHTGEFEDQPVSDTGTRRYGIYASLDRSLDSAKGLLNTLHVKMEEQRQTQLRLLQAQINPHFLYNTLDTVQWLVRANEKESTGKVISALTRYLRRILNNGNDVVPIEDELDLVNAYIEIQRHRFGDTFDLEILMEPEASGCLLPKMTLQPVVENALHHGIFKQKNRRGAIAVDIYTEAGTLCLSVTDNGAGMNETTLKELLTASPRNNKSGFGLHNVRSRILIFSGSGSFGMEIESEEGKYTTVTLKLAEKHEGSNM